MRKYNEQLQKADVLLALDGLTPPSTMSARHLQKRKVESYLRPVYRSEGSGPRLLRDSVKSREETPEWASHIPGSDNEMVEVRRSTEITDFPADVQEKLEKFEQHTAEGGDKLGQQ